MIVRDLGKYLYGKMQNRSATILERYFENRHTSQIVPPGQKLDTTKWRYQERYKPYYPAKRFYKQVDKQPPSWTPEQVQQHAVNKSKDAHKAAADILSNKFPNLLKMTNFKHTKTKEKDALPSSKPKHVS